MTASKAVGIDLSNPADWPHLLTIWEASQVLRTSEKTLRRLLAANALPFVLVGTGIQRQRQLIRAADLLTYIQVQTVENVPMQNLSGRSSKRFIQSDQGGFMAKYGNAKPPRRR